jgi:DNA-binding CsgD family transcriptional regulator
MTRKLHGREPAPFVRYQDALTCGARGQRFMAHALATLTASVPVTRAWMWAVDRRGLMCGDIVLLTPRPQPFEPADAMRAYQERYWHDDPFAPHRYRDRRRRVVTVADIGGRKALAATNYGRDFLPETGFAHRLVVHVWNQGRLASVATLLRTAAEPEFAGHEVAFLHRVQPLVSLAHAAAEQPVAELEAEDLLASGGLRPRQIEVARMAASGLSNAEIAHALELSPETVKRHLSTVYAKLDLRSRTELSARLGLERR